MNCIHSTKSQSSFSYGIRAITILSVTAAAITLGLLLSRPECLSQDYFWHNTLDSSTRLKLIYGPFAAAAITASTVIIAWLFFVRRGWNLTEQLWRFSLICSPLAPLTFIPVFINWSIWQDRDIPFLLLVLIEVLAFRATVTAALSARPIDLVTSAQNNVAFDGETRQSKLPRLSRNVWLALVVATTLYYVIWFSYYTSIWHLSGRSGYDFGYRGQHSVEHCSRRSVLPRSSNARSFRLPFSSSRNIDLISPSAILRASPVLGDGPHFAVSDAGIGCVSTISICASALGECRRRSSRNCLPISARLAGEQSFRSALRQIRSIAVFHNALALGYSADSLGHCSSMPHIGSSRGRRHLGGSVGCMGRISRIARVERVSSLHYSVVCTLL